MPPEKVYQLQIYWLARLRLGTPGGFLFTNSETSINFFDPYQEIHTRL